MTLPFVVGTGRCGSTLVPRLPARHHEVLTLSEFFNALRPRPYLTGAPFNPDLRLR